jgi:hypothetical protein
VRRWSRAEGEEKFSFRDYSLWRALDERAAVRRYPAAAHCTVRLGASHAAARFFRPRSLAILRDIFGHAAFLNSTLSAAEAQKVERALVAGELDLLYVAPARLLTPRCLDLRARAKLALFAIDDARIFVPSFDQPNIRHTIVDKAAPVGHQLRHLQDAMGRRSSDQHPGSWLAGTPVAALKGIRRMAFEVVDDLKGAGETIPVPLAEKHYSGQFRVRLPPEVHRALAMQAAEQGVSLNRLASAKLAA